MTRDMPATPEERDRLVLDAMKKATLDYRTPSETWALIQDALFSARWGLTPAPGERFGGLGVLTSPPPGQPGGAMVRE